MKTFLILILALSLISSCKMQQLYLNVLEPAPVTVPPYIKNTGVIKRTVVEGATSQIDKIEKVVTLEGANIDKEGTDAAVSGLTEELMRNNRFAEVRPLVFIKVESPGMGVFPPPIDWVTVARLCMENKVDALFSLEVFDTDTKISYQIRKSTGKTLLGALTGYEQQADMLTTVKTGWRIYDPAGKNILDEITITKNLTFSSTGLTPVIAAAALMDRKEAVKRVGNNAGIAFAQRILPYEIRVYRDYYVKGTDNFRIAMRKARTGNWDQAGELWKVGTSNPSPKIAGRASYNMAIISEINGNLDVALEWARKSYEDYNIRQALRYLNILKYRLYRFQQLQEQNVK